MKKPLLIFYILVVYVFIQFGWWLYLIIDLNKQLYFLNSENLPSNWLYRKTWMTFGEGFVFFILLLIGAYFTHYFLKKQVQMVQQQQNFLLSVTHELKTPITALQMILENIRNPKVGETQKEQMVSGGINSLHRLSALINNLIYSAKADTDNFKLPVKYQNISDCILHELEKTMQNPRISHDISPGRYASFNHDALKIILHNLIDNALKYSEENITVKLFQSQNKIVLEVVDYGIGIPNNQKKSIFRKFYRIGNENTRKTSGTGIGLYLAKKFAEMQNARIFVKDNTPKGSIFAVEFTTKKS
ncbi:MAG: sensor histidine kinase [Bacteroidetes bacterium]|nr:MAG: sensor histidine kinase [Bacteroidota bacterium]